MSLSRVHGQCTEKAILLHQVVSISLGRDINSAVGDIPASLQTVALKITILVCTPFDPFVVDKSGNGLILVRNRTCIEKQVIAVDAL